MCFFFFFNDTATTEIYTLSLHDALPISNIFYKESGQLFSRASTILERDGIRLGVIGIIGLDARSVILPSYVEALDFRDPIPYVRNEVEELRSLVDVIVVLTHQGKTGPMQTDAEHRPEVQRDFEEDIKLAGAVEGIDVIVSGHAHRGDRKSTRLNSSHVVISYAVFCLKKKKTSS